MGLMLSPVCISSRKPLGPANNMTDSLASGTYEVLRGRMREAAEDLRGRFQRLNTARGQVFGNIETKLCGTAHVSTSHNCVPRDLLSIGELLVLGYNVNFGLKSEIAVADVFSVYQMEGEIAHAKPLETIFDDRFSRDFRELYRYYKNTTFARFTTIGPFVYFVFQVGKSTSDVKAFKWAIEGETLKYVDNRSDHEVKLPQQHGFQWQRTTREQHRSGEHPHVSIADIVFVECVGGDLTVKVEDSTSDGAGIYSEPVEDADQTLDDAEVYYALLGNLVLLKMRPYQERDFRYLVFSTKLQAVTRLDAIAKACVLLPDDHGIIFAGGVFLQNGQHKLFDHGLKDLVYERTIASPNGEDYLYLFTDLATGTYLHLRYNVIRQQVDTPLVCHGQAFFDDGKMTSFRSQDHPQKHHALQLWQTAFVGPNYQSDVDTDSMLYKIGNRELVGGMSECQELLQLVDKDDSYDELYMDIAKRATDILDGYFWIDRDETEKFSEPIAKIRDAANAAVEEFDKVVRVRRETDAALAQSQQAAKQIVAAIGRSSFDSVETFVEKLAELREQRGHAIGLRERKYIDLEAVEKLELELSEATERLGHRCVQFLLSPRSLGPYSEQIVECEARIEKVGSAAEGRSLQADLDGIGAQLELLIETVSQLKIDDLTQRTAITDETGNLLADLNRVRSTLKARVRDLLSGEMEADYASQTKLLDQAATGALETADTPQRVDEALTRMMLQLEELEGRFAEFDELLERLTEKRQSIYEAFETRREQLVESRTRRAEGLATAADRIMQGIQSRALRQEGADELRSYFASDPMVDKVRQIAGQLQELGDTVRMDDILGRLKTVSDDALRQLRDRKDLFVGGEGQIKLGKHFFNVNTHPVELTTVVRNERLQLHLTGTQFYQPLVDSRLDGTEDLWLQFLPSENDSVYRCEFLASQLAGPAAAENLLAREQPERIEWVRSHMQSAHDGGYSRGVHDTDTERILTSLLTMQKQLGLLQYSPSVRGAAWYAWQTLVPAAQRDMCEKWLQGLATIESLLPDTSASDTYVSHIALLLEEHAWVLFEHSAGERADATRLEAAEFLFRLLRRPKPGLVCSPVALHLSTELDEHLPARDREQLTAALTENASRPLDAWSLALDATDGYLRHVGQGGTLDPASNYRTEIATILLVGRSEVQPGSDQPVAAEIEGLVGDHKRISAGKLPLHFHEFRTRLGQYQAATLPRFQRLRDTKHELLLEAEGEVRSSEFKPRVLSSFIRNRLIDEVYLPLVGDNLAKQMGSAGDSSRTDRMGLLLLISPPGYGKTTLMEYVANRLGLVFVKVNGPALGHNVTSLDPEEATNASAREEVKRINLALEMGDNVMLYLDDIQHCNPELLQKFIPLCDATRRIEGVYNGQPKQYDLRGRKVCVVMAGNPYTESGERFQVPDMLSNRADVYNLGEIIGESREVFELSYIENCLTSNAVLQPLSRASSADQHGIFKAARRGTIESLELESNISADQMSDIMSVLSKLIQVRDVILKVNRGYIRSAGQVDAYRTEPPFKLQGSYRNMNRIAERVVSVMNDDELMQLVVANYEQDSQTLTSDSESNLLKFKELIGALTEADQKRWDEIKYAYVESVRMQGVEGDDSAAQILRSLTGLRDGLESIRRTLAQAVASGQADTNREILQQGMGELAERLGDLGETLSSSMEASAEKRDASLPEQKVIVQHSVPRVITDLVRSQFQLLYDGLKPALESSAVSAKQLGALKASMDDCLQQYRNLKADIEEASGSTTPESKPTDSSDATR